MARRQKTSPARDVIDHVAMAAWWVGVLLAVISYPALHQFAVSALPAPPAGNPTANLMPMLLRGLAQAGQFAVPVLCLAGAAVSAWKRRERSVLLEQAAGSPGLGALAGMTWREFDLLVGEAYRRQGYRVVETGGGGADGGVDLVLSRPSDTGDERVLVQCKHWRAERVGVTVVRELYGVMAAQGAARGVVVTGGRYTDEALRFADGRNLQLVDGPAPEAMLAEVRRANDP